MLLVPLNVRAFPVFPLVVQVALLRLPVLALPDASMVVVPIPSPKAYAATSPLPVGASAKAAATFVAAVMFTVHVALVPVHAPLQPVKVEPVVGAAVSVVLVPLAKFALQVLPQLIPLALEVTVPLPLPLLVTVRL